MEKGEEERKEEEEPRTGGAVCKRSVQFLDFFFFFLVNLSELMDQVDVVFLLVFFLKMREFEII